jgi:hypothetical protein
MIDDVTLPAQGALFMGERGQLLFPHVKGEIALLPRKDFSGVKLPDPELPRPAHHHAEWIEACKGRGKTLSDFSYGGRMSELVQAGVVAYRLGKRLDWDGPNLRATNAPEADALIKPEFRSGWRL